MLKKKFETCFDEILRKAILSRRVEETLLDLFATGEISGTVHTCLGQEFSGSVITEHLVAGDTIFSNHRCHGHFLSFTNNTYGLLAELMGKKSGVCAGLGGSQHLCDANFFSSGIQGGIVPIAAGIALGKKRNNKKNISVVFIGDGTLGEGVVYETLNLASKWNLPLLIVLENNLYAQSTAQHETLAGDILSRASAFDWDVYESSTWNLEHLFDTSEVAIKNLREKNKPAFLKINTYRLGAHSKGDDFRNKAEVEEYEKKDTLNLLKSDKNISSKYLSIENELNLIIQQALDKIRKENEIALESINEFIEMDTSAIWENIDFTPEKIRNKDLLNKSFHKIMEDEKVFFIGEDVMCPYGGAFGISQGLSDAFPGRVLNTPISEAAITGVGIGLSLEGFIPFVEIMFGDFLTLAFDQLLNHAAKFSFMYNQKVETNMIVRTPMGGGRGYGPTHSQSIEKHFVGIPGLRVLATNNVIDQDELLHNLTHEKIGATLLIENKITYGLFNKWNGDDGFELLKSKDIFPSILSRARNKKVDFLIIAYGGMSEIALEIQEEVFEKHDFLGDVLIPTQIYPFNILRFKEILDRTHLICFIEEGQIFSSFSSEVIAQIVLTESIGNKTFTRFGPRSIPLPSNASLEKQALPDKEFIIKTILEKLDI